MEKAALVIIDLQNDYFDGGRFPLVNAGQASENAALLLEHARRCNDLVVHVRHESPEADASFFVPGTAGAKINLKVLPAENEPVVVKNSINAFLGTNLQSILQGNAIENIVVAGAMSHICVDAFVRAASDFGYKITVAHDAVATRDLKFNGRSIAAADVHAAFMAALAFGYARVVSTDDVTSATSGVVTANIE
jgi:nicotinamidase-related amidase